MKYECAIEARPSTKILKQTILFIFLLLIYGCNQQIDKNEEKSNERIPKKREIASREYGGKVRVITEYDCSGIWKKADELIIDKNTCEISSVKEFSKDEVLISEKKWYSFEKAKEPYLIGTSILNDSGQIVKTIVKQTGIFKQEAITEISYNEAGFETSCLGYVDGVFSRRVDKVYDEYNCLIKEVFYDKNQKIQFYYINEYDTKNRIISTKRFNSNNTLETEWRNEYEGDNEDWIARNTYDGTGKLIDTDDLRESIKTNKLDFIYTTGLPDAGFKDVEYYTDGKVKKWHYKNMSNHDVYQTYDESGRITECKIYDNNEWQQTYTWKYREDGAVVEQSESTSRVVGKNYYKTTTYFKVDFNGNWIEKIQVDSENRIIEIKFREYEYYF